MPNKKRFFFSAIFLLVIFSSKTYSEKINFSANSMSGKTGGKNDVTRLTGNAYIKTESMEIKADKITLAGENFRFITAEGKVSGTNTSSKIDFTCDKMRYDRSTKIANLEDNVHMIDSANEVTSDAQIIEYNQNTDIATMHINVKLIQKDNICNAAYAVYNKKTKLLELSGNPRITQGDDTFRAQEIQLNLDTNEITLDGRVSGNITDNSKPEKEETAPAQDENKSDPPDETNKQDESNGSENVKPVQETKEE